MTRHCCTFGSSPSQKRLHRQQSLLRNDRFPRIIPNSVCKTIQNPPHRINSLLLAPARKYDHHDRSPPAYSLLHRFTSSNIKSSALCSVNFCKQICLNSLSLCPLMAQIKLHGRTMASLIKSATSKTRAPRLVLPCITAKP